MKLLLILFLSFSASFVHCQIHLSLSRILDYSQWHCADTSMLKNCERLTIRLKEDSITQYYVDLTNDFHQIRCAYSTQVTDSYFELEIRNCPEPSSSLKYVYGYLVGDKLRMLFAERRFTSIKEAQKQPGWILFDRFLE